MTILCTIDLLTREVVLPGDQCIAAYDHNVDVIHFQAEPVDGFDFDTSTIKIAAQGPNKARHDYAVDPSTVQIEEETGYITFDWPIPAGVTEMPEDMFGYGSTGQLIFAVCAEIITGSTLSKAWHSDDGIITVVAHLEPEAGGGEDPSETATNAQKIAQLQTDVTVINTQVGALGNGSPTPVATVAEMTDESAVYLYMGSETGYTAGNWYYYDGSAWTSGGTYGGAVTDTTLTIEGAAADAKVVGDALALKADSSEIGGLSQLTTTAKDNLVSAINEVNEVTADTSADVVQLKADLANSACENIFDNYTPITGKYYDGNEGDNPSYNYYIVPVLKGVMYKVIPKMRMYVLKQGDTNVEINTNDNTSFIPSVNGFAYITVYASDTVSMIASDTDTTLEKIGKPADAEATGKRFIPIENHSKNYDFTVFASEYIEGKYYGTNGTTGTSASYNYYTKIPVVKGNTYHFVGGRGARYVVLYNNNVIVQTAENTTVFTAQYDGELYVTEFSDTPLKMYLYNDFYKLDSWTNNNINGKTGTASSNTIPFATDAGDICHFKLNGYSGQYFTNCLLYAVQSGGNVIVASLYSDTGEYVFIAPSATTYIVYINKSQSETATIYFELTNLIKHTIFNSITRHDIINRFMPHIYGKKIACLGDSFTYGVDTYVAKLNKRYLSHAINYGVASSRIVLDTTSGGNTIQSFLNRYSAMDNDAEIVTIFGGINDSYDIGSGALNIGDINSELDTTTFYGGLKLLVTNLMKKYPDKQIIGIIPPDCQTGAYYIANLPAVQNAEREVYNMYGIPFIDLKRECYKMSTLSEMVALYRAASNNIHPSNAGQEALCDTISAGIRRIIP